MCAFVRFLKIFDVRIFVRLLAKICAHLSLELLNTLILHFQWLKFDQRRFKDWERSSRYRHGPTQFLPDQLTKLTTEGAEQNKRQ